MNILSYDGYTYWYDTNFNFLFAILNVDLANFLMCNNIYYVSIYNFNIKITLLDPPIVYHDPYKSIIDDNFDLFTKIKKSNKLLDINVIIPKIKYRSHITKNINEILSYNEIN